jgi:hypothetical protein
VAIPPELDRYVLNGAVLCSASEQGHVHGSCHSSPFKVVLVGKGRNDLMACVYSSHAGVWGNLITTAGRFHLFAHHVPATLIGNALYWLPFTDSIVEFDLDGHNLAVIGGPPVTCDLQDGSSHIIQSEDGVVGLAIYFLTHAYKCGIEMLIAMALPRGFCGRPLKLKTFLGDLGPRQMAL